MQNSNCLGAALTELTENYLFYNFKIVLLHRNVSDKYSCHLVQYHFSIFIVDTINKVIEDSELDIFLLNVVNLSWTVLHIEVTLFLTLTG